MSRFTIINCKQSTMTVPLTIGIVGCSYSGKTCSAHRVSQGIKRTSGGGPVVYIDTEGGRALEFRRQFDFEHLPMPEPYGSLDYCDAIDAALDLNPSCIIIDSLSHEHEGIGGYMHVASQELEKGVKEGSHWATGAGYRRRLLSKLNTLPCSTILCLRAKESLDWKSVFKKQSKQPAEIGYVPIGGADFVFMMTCRMLLVPEPPNSPMKGAPIWNSDLKGDIETMKLGPFGDLFSERRQLTEEDGEAMARWAQGQKVALPSDHTPQPGSRMHNLMSLIGMADTKEKFDEARMVANKTNGYTKAEKEQLRKAFAEAEGKLT